MKQTISDREEYDEYHKSDLKLLNNLARKIVTSEEQEQTETDLWRNCFNVTENPLHNFVISSVAIAAIGAAWRAIVAGKIETLSDFHDFRDRVAKAA